MTEPKVTAEATEMLAAGVEFRLNQFEGKLTSMDDRLRAVEIGVAEIRRDMDHLKTTMATKNDVTLVSNKVTDLKVWALTGVIIGMVAAAGIALGVARLMQ